MYEYAYMKIRKEKELEVEKWWGRHHQAGRIGKEAAVM